MKQLKNPKHAFYQNGSMQKSLIDRDTHTSLSVNAVTRLDIIGAEVEGGGSFGSAILSTVP